MQELSNSSTVQEFFPSLNQARMFTTTQSLHHTRVPGHARQTLTPGYTAALSHQSQQLAKNSSRRVTVVGGRGVMGQFFVQQLSAAGHIVNILEQDNWSHAKQLLDGADLALICVPIEYTQTVIRDIAQYLSPTTALADITSVKAPIVQTMLSCHSGPVMGLHPMFGPKVSSFQSQNIVVCPGRTDEAFQWLLKLIKQEGGKLMICTPEEHDRMMITIQSLRHFVSFSLGIFLTDEGIDIQQSLELASPSYRELIDMTNRLFCQSGELVADIMLFTQERREAIVKLADTFNRLAQLAMHNDRESLIREFQSAQGVWAALSS
jgi:prephenate dehydrogenase/chorismate mutase/prephenate dehydrogenase